MKLMRPCLTCNVQFCSFFLINGLAILERINKINGIDYKHRICDL